MSDQNKTRQNATVAAKSKHGWKVIAGAVVLAIILLQSFWNMIDSKVEETVAKQMESLKAELEAGIAGLDARITESDRDSLDLEAVKLDIASAKKAAEDFEMKLSAIIEAEELKLAGLEKNAEDQKAYIDELKSLSGAGAQ